MKPVLPPPRTAGRYAIELVCLGNICRSPMAHVVLEQALDDAGLDQVEVTSSGTGGWHVGDPMDPRAAATLTSAAYDATRHRARQFTAGRWSGLDLVLAMDGSNLDAIQTDAEPGRLMLFRAFDPVEPGADVPDPYYGGDAGFAAVLAMVQRTSDALVDALAHELQVAR